MVNVHLQLFQKFNVSQFTYTDNQVAIEKIGRRFNHYISVMFVNRKVVFLADYGTINECLSNYFSTKCVTEAFASSCTRERD